MNAALATFAAFLVIASVGISVLNWASMPSGAWATVVAGAIAFGLEGAKLVLVPFGFVQWRDGYRAQAVSALIMGTLITAISVGGIVIWLDNNLAINAGAKATAAKVDAIQNARINIAVELVKFEKLSKADSILDKAEASLARDRSVATESEPGLTIPFDLDASGRWELLLGIALSIDLGALMLITFLSLGKKNLLNKEKCATRAPAQAERPEDRPKPVLPPKTATRKTLDAFMAAKPAEKWFGPPFEKFQASILSDVAEAYDVPVESLVPDPVCHVEHPVIKTLPDRQQKIADAILAGKHGSPLESMAKIAKAHKIRAASVRTVITYLIETKQLTENRELTS